MEAENKPVVPTPEPAANNTPEAPVAESPAQNVAEETSEDCLEAVAAELPEEEAVAADLEAVQEEPRHRLMTKEELTAKVKELAQQDAPDISADELARLKQQFYQLRGEEQRREQEQFIADGGNPEEFTSSIDPLEEEFKVALATVKEKKAEQRRLIEEAQQANLTRKRAIIEELKSLGEDADNAGRNFTRARELQAEFATIGDVPGPDATQVWKDYQDVRERFYDQFKINMELRDYDFRKNLSEKQLLIDEAEDLAAHEEDVITAFRRLQDLHDKWRRIGPVAKELREEIWLRFKDASAVINKKYQAHFEERKAREAENEAKKTALCERVEALDFSGLRSFAAWDEMTRTFTDAQAEWKGIGFASRKSNNDLFARFRKVCDAFFTAKADYFRAQKETFAANLAKKTELCERAEALKDSTDWRKATEEFVAMQKEWKTIGPVAKKNSDAIWQRFLGACDHFFEQKKQNTSGVRRTEQANLQLKQEVIDRLAALTAPDAAEMDRDEAVALLADLRRQWGEIGHVPFRLKDQLYDNYRQLLRDAERRYDVRGDRARAAAFDERVAAMDGDKQKLFRERERLARAAERSRTEIATYENNLGFLSVKSGKGGDGLVREMERRVQRLRDDLKSLEEKIAALDAKLQ